MKNIVVTGAGRGLGRYIVLEHLQKGDRVIGLLREMSMEMQALKVQYPEQLQLVRCDVACYEDTLALKSSVGALVDHIHILYNVAGVNRLDIGRRHLKDSDLSEEAFNSIYTVNALGPMRVCQGVWNLIGENTVVVNVSSESGSIGDCKRKNEYAYCMSKSALNMGSKLLANELEALGARVLVVHPGWVRTDMGGPEAAASDESISPEESAAHVVKLAQKAAAGGAQIQFVDHTGAELPW